MKRWFYLLLALCLTLLIFSACAGKNKDIQSVKDVLDELPVELDADTSKLLDKIDDVEITPPPATEANIKISAVLPEGWIEEEKKNSIVSYSKETNFVEVLKAWKPDEVKDAKGLAEYEKEVVGDSFEDSVFHDIENTKVSGIDAVRISIDIPIGSIKQRQTYVYFEKGGDFYKIMLASFLDDEDGMKDMESILESMKIE